MLRTFDSQHQAEASRNLARTARRLAESVNQMADRARLLRYAQELEAQADRSDPALAVSLASH